MVKGILDEKTGHEWDKQNLITKHDKDGMYDVWYCVHCKKTFKRRGVSWHPPQTICKKHAPNTVSTGQELSAPTEGGFTLPLMTNTSQDSGYDPFRSCR